MLGYATYDMLRNAIMHKYIWNTRLHYRIFYIILHYTTRYYTMLYYATLCYTILYDKASVCSSDQMSESVLIS